MKTVVWIVLIIVLSSLIVFVGCKNKGDIMDGPDMVNNQEELPPPTDGPGMVKPEEPKEEGEKLVDGMKIEDIKVGEGEAVKEGDTVKVHYTGTPAGVLKGGFKKERNNEIKIKCTLADLPETITADISGINVSEALRVKDLKVGKNVEVLTDAELPWVTVSPAR